MLISTTPERLETCRLASQYPAIRVFIESEIIRIISTGGIDVTNNKEKELQMVIDLFIPYEKDPSKKPGTVLGPYVKGPYILHVEQGIGLSVAHSFRVTRNSPN